VALEYKHATKTGNFSDMPIEALVDHILEHTIADPPIKGSPEYKLICQKASEAMRDKLETYRFPSAITLA
jgi:hypothetical protein